mgnify:CR=1 FL=1|jgi:hypothetical protein
MEQTSIKKIGQDVELIKKLVLDIKEQMEDCFLTVDEETNLDTGLLERKKGIAFSLEDIEKSRNA